MANSVSQGATYDQLKAAKTIVEIDEDLTALAAGQADIIAANTVLAAKVDAMSDLLDGVPDIVTATAALATQIGDLQALLSASSGIDKTAHNFGTMVFETDYMPTIETFLDKATGLEGMPFATTDTCNEYTFTTTDPQVIDSENTRQLCGITISEITALSVGTKLLVKNSDGTTIWSAQLCDTLNKAICGQYVFYPMFTIVPGSTIGIDTADSIKVRVHTVGY